MDSSHLGLRGKAAYVKTLGSAECSKLQLPIGPSHLGGVANPCSSAKAPRGPLWGLSLSPGNLPGPGAKKIGTVAMT